MSREAHSLFTCIFAGKTSVMIRYLLRAADGALSILVVFLLLAGTVVYSGYLLGEDLTSPPEYRKVDILPTGKECRELGTSRFQMVSAGEGIWQLRTLRGRPAGWLINSRPYAGDVSGFGGPTPVWIYLNTDNQVERILPGENSETATFFERALNGGILERWRGVAASQADEQEVDAVSGATYSSRALTANVQAALSAFTHQREAPASAPSIGWLRTVAVALVLLLGIYVSLFRRGNPTWRLVQLALNVVVTGFWCGQFLSVSLLRGWIEGGFHFISFLPAVLMLAVALVMPLFGRRRHYCTWVCPYGSLQALAYALPVPKLKLSAGALRVMHRVRTVVLALLLLALWLGFGASLLDYEPFTAFLFTTAAPAVLVLAAAFVVLAVFVPAPWCHALCPMGELLNLAEPSKKQKK